MKDLSKHLPNSITCINLFCGCLAIIFALERQWEIVMYLVIIALVADFLDGFVARTFKLSSPIGGELDSLADMVTFGLLPGMVMFRLMSDLACTGKCTGLLSPNIYPYIAFIIPILSAVRLAKFNVDTTQTYHFRGLPTPANAMFFVSIPFLSQETELHPKFVLLLVVFFSMLLVSDIHLIALKFKSKKLIDNWEKILLLICGIVLIIIFRWTAFAYLIPCYLAISVLFFLKEKRK